MIWVIGDIHGMFDPLKRLLTQIQVFHYRSPEYMKIKKLIFIGDYIDHGPSSKEVIDYITDLPFEKIFLMGNHEDLMLQFIENSDLYQNYGNVWFRGNGGQRTVNSFFPKKHLLDRDEEDFERDQFQLSEKYYNFFKTLKISHTEVIGDLKFSFVHAGLNPDFPIDEQLSLKNFDEFHAWRKANKVWIEDTLLWIRDEPTKRFGDRIIVHGHTPTTNLTHSYKKLHGYDPALALPFFKFETREEDDDYPIEFADEGYSGYSYSGNYETLISINVDTGAVYGKRLTALGINEEDISEGGGKYDVYQICVDKGYRLATDTVNTDIILTEV